MSLASSPPAYEPASGSDLDRLIGEIAKRHHVLLDRNDPVFIAVTLNELVLAKVIAQIEAGVEAAKIDIAAGAARQIEAAKSTASRLITAAADYAEEQFRLAANEAAEDVRAGLLRELAQSPVTVDAGKILRAASYMRWAIAFIYLAATVTALVAVSLPFTFAMAPLPASCGAALGVVAGG
jgi:hypothetical protein